MSNDGITFDQIIDRSFWQRMAPDLHLEDSRIFSSAQIFEPSPGCPQCMKCEGYFQVENLDWRLPIEKMATLIERLMKQNLPPVFAFVYDEYWVLFHSIRRVLESVIDKDFHRLPRFWGFFIDPSMDQSGIEPHRDSGPEALFEDGMPITLTVWIPLTDATPLNGCIYVVPADRDPNYGKPSADFRTIRHQDIRALPGKAGDVFVWNQCVTHWGAHSSPRASMPRIAVAMEFQSPKVAARMVPVTSECPSFEFRLRNIGRQLLEYQGMFPLNAQMELLAARLQTLPAR